RDRRTVVINGGKKVYDGSLDALLNSFQEQRIITMSFDTETEPELEFEAEWLEKSPLKAVFMVRKDLVKPAIQSLLNRYDVNDIRIEEEEIGGVIEKIYTAGKKGDSICENILK
ncbi:MAG: multidrug ABC transporter ATP-binding protein, partial [Clostridia bacterium]|nr:multidrug ABC transporter ATP-binding protein [Clostridia bacterium]